MGVLRQFIAVEAAIVDAVRVVEDALMAAVKGWAVLLGEVWGAFATKPTGPHRLESIPIDLR